MVVRLRRLTAPRNDSRRRNIMQKTAPSKDRAVISTYVSTNEPKDSLRTTDLAVQPLDKLEFGEQSYMYSMGYFLISNAVCFSINNWE